MKKKLGKALSAVQTIFYCLSTILFSYSSVKAADYLPSVPAKIYDVIDTKDKSLSFPGISFTVSGCTDLNTGGDIPCEDLIKQAFPAVLADPNKPVIKDQDTTFQSIYDAGRRLQQQIENNWWAGDNLDKNDAILKYYIDFNHELIAHKKDPTSPYKLFQDDGSGNITFSKLGAEKWGYL